MTGSDLVALAAHLIANTAFGNAEARYRSAISRAYYGAFHLTISFLDEVAGIRVVENHTGHEQAYRLLLNTNIPAAIKAARTLASLRTARNQADYKLQFRGLDSRVKAQSWVEAAFDVGSCLDDCRNEPIRSQIFLALMSERDDIS